MSKSIKKSFEKIQAAAQKQLGKDAAFIIYTEHGLIVQGLASEILEVYVNCDPVMNQQIKDDIVPSIEPKLGQAIIDAAKERFAKACNDPDCKGHKR